MSWVQHQQQPQQPPQTSSALMSNSIRQHTGGSLESTSTALNSSKHQKYPSMQQQHQGHLSNNQPPQQHWQQQNYMQMNPTMMQPAATAPNTYSQTPANNWPQSNVPGINANVYQPEVPSNNWQQPDLQAPAEPVMQLPPQSQQPQQQTAGYAGFYAPQPQENYMPQQYPAEASFSSHQTQPGAQQPVQQNANPQDFFDKSNSQNDGWNDWDWNDNSNNTSNVTDQQQTRHQQQEQEQQTQQQSQINANVIEDSFQTNTNDNWQWGVEENANQPPVQQPQQSQIHQQQLPVVAAPAAVASAPTQFYQPQVPRADQVPKTVPQQNVGEYSMATSKPAAIPLVAETIDANISAKPNSLQLNEIANEHYNNAGGVAPTSSTTTNIPSPVYVSQAKPVSKPSRQYASPPGVTPTELPDSSTLSPPHAFQNDNGAEGVMAPPPPPTTSQQTPVLAAEPPLAPPAITATVQPPPSMTPPSSLPPLGGNSGNPFKRAGAAQHHRSVFMPTNTVTPQPMPVAPISNFVVPPPPADFANPMEPLTTDIIEPDNSEILHENQEVLAIAAQTITMPAGVSTAPLNQALPPPNDERNQYLQTSHLSENPDEELNIEADSFPPPGLSRLVLGQPELEASQRMVTGTEVPSVVSNMNIDERQADGEDTSTEQPVAIMGATQSSTTAPNRDITTDRNLYLVPGESNLRNEQRVVTGVERVEDQNPVQIINEQREIELDGENLEDQQQLQQQQQQQQLQQQPPNPTASRNEPPLEGAAANSTPAAPVNIIPNTIDSHNQINSKDLSNISTGNDESDPHNDHRYNKITRKHENISERKHDKHRKEKQRSVDRYDESEDSDEYASDRDRDIRRKYREGSVRSERDKERDLKERKRRDMRRDFGDEREKPRDKHHYRVESGERGEGVRSERRSNRYHRYDADSKYETEESTRYESIRKDRRGRNERDRDGRSDRSERDYDDYNRRYPLSKRDSKRETDERKRRDPYIDDERRRRGGGGGGGGGRADRDYRDDYDTIERRNRREKHRGDQREYEEYRKQSSRNARESDLDKERRDPRYDQRHAAMYGYPSTYGYDPYAYYYEQMARTNPQAYSEWYKKYYAHATATLGAGGDHLTAAGSAVAADGRESVHSGRSSANNEKDRFTHAFLSQANEYHRHFMHQQQEQQQLAANMSQTMNSTMLEESVAGSQSNQNYIYGLSGGRSTGNLSQIHPPSSAVGAGCYYGAAGPTPGHLDHYYARSEYADSRSGNLSLRDADPIVSDPQRLTPCKFVNDHAVVSFSAGLLVTVKPKYTPHGVSNIVKLLRLGAHDSTRQLFHAFPGPLVRGLTHKKTIIEFCEEQIRLGPTNTTIFAKQLLSSNGDKYQASYTLMWNLLILLLRQNGMVVGTDIAELLLKNQTQFPYMSQSNTSSATTASNSSKTHSKSESDSNEEINSKDSDDEEIVDERPAPEVPEAQDQDQSLTSTSKSSAAVTSISEDAITEKFRNYLLYGNVNEALDWATDNNLWGHALFLASKMDRRTHANVMMKFANKLSLNDPLQTLYQLMSGRTPSSVTSVQDEKWGDWRPHLSMILSNTSQKPELDRKAITTLGDSLFNRGDLYAAHFCYLMAQVGFGRYQDGVAQETNTLQQNLPKLVLLGSSHYKTFKEFATNEAIIMTEIYEYACSLNDDKFSLVEFQPYKYLLASRILDYGYQLKSLMYLEQISLHIQRDPSKYEPSFINKVYELADRLKFYDPVLEKSMDEQQNMDGSLNSSVHNFEEQKWLQVLRGIAAENKIDYAPISNYTNSGNVQENYPNQIDEQFAEINKQFSELNMQYNNNIEPPVMYNPEQLQQPPSQTNDNVDPYNQDLQQQQLTSMTNNMEYDATHYAQTQQAAYPSAETTTNPPENVAENYANYAQQYQQQQQQQQQSQTGYYDPNQQQTQYNPAEATETQNSGSYDYWGGQQQQQPVDETARPTISMPNAKKSYDSDNEEREPKNQQQSQEKASSSSQAKKSKNDGKDSNKSSQSGSNQNSGWFGGIWNKLSLKPKNQMILPDDKNPTIIWDSEKKRWVNKDGDDNGEEVMKPPPKMSDLMSQQQQSQSQPQHHQHQQPPQLPLENSQYGGGNPMQQPPAVGPSAVPMQAYSAIGTNVGSSTTPAPSTATTTSTEPTKPPSLQSNMFKMQRNRTLKNSYVDVFNPSGAPMSKAAENVLAPALPPAAVPQGGFFIPGAPIGNDAGAYQQQQQQPEASQDHPQFYNPNQFGGAGGSY